MGQDTELESGGANAEDETRSHHEVAGGEKLDGDTRRNLIDAYRLRERGGRVYWINAHKDVTAELVASRYEGHEETETNVWAGHYVGVWTRNQDVVEDVTATVPELEIEAEIRTWRVEDGE